MGNKEFMSISSFALGLIALLFKIMFIMNIFFSINYSSQVYEILIKINNMMSIFIYGIIILGALSLKSKKRIYSILGIIFASTSIALNVLYVIIAFAILAIGSSI